MSAGGMGAKAPVFRRGDVVISACAIGRVNNGEVGNVIGKPNDDGFVMVMFDNGVSEWCDPRHLNRPQLASAFYVRVSDLEALRAEFCADLQREMMTEAADARGARTQRDGRWHDARAKFAANMLDKWRRITIVVDQDATD